MEALTNFFLDKNCRNVLDVGTGSGNFIKVLKAAFPTAIITGVDPVSDSLAEAKKNYNDVQFIQGKAERLPFRAGAFDVAGISFALHHLAKVSKGLRELKRVVKRDGWIIVNEIVSDNLNPAQEVHKMYHHFRSRIDRITGVSHHETFKKEQVIEIIEDAGISIQFFFENKVAPESKNVSEIEKRMQVMQNMLEKINDKPEYVEMKNQISEFKEMALLHGLQQATSIVVVGRKIR